MVEVFPDKKQNTLPRQQLLRCQRREEQDIRLQAGPERDYLQQLKR